MKAYKKYKGSRDPEHMRRIAQSLGYRSSIQDNPKMIALLKRAGIHIEHTQLSHTKITQHSDIASAGDTLIIS